jgi:hypothetical protein
MTTKAALDGRVNEPQRIVIRPIAGPDGKIIQVAVNLAESPVSWLFARGRISQRQHDAAEALRRDWERSQLGPRVTMSWESAAAPSSARRAAPAAPDLAAGALTARNRLDGALAAAGPGLCDILWRVACAGEGLAAAEGALGWPVRAGKLVLGFALDRVANYYRIG